MTRNRMASPMIMIPSLLCAAIDRKPITGIVTITLLTVALTVISVVSPLITFFTDAVPAAMSRDCIV